MAHSVRIASGQGFWGDLQTAPIDQVRKGQIDYMMLDYLAEVTMSILQKQFSRDPQLGYARDFVQMIERGARVKAHDPVAMEPSERSWKATTTFPSHPILRAVAG